MLIRKSDILSFLLFFGFIFIFCFLLVLPFILCAKYTNIYNDKSNAKDRIEKIFGSKHKIKNIKITNKNKTLKRGEFFLGIGDYRENIVHINNIEFYWMYNNKYIKSLFPTERIKFEIDNEITDPLVYFTYHYPIPMILDPDEDIIINQQMEIIVNHPVIILNDDQFKNLFEKDE